MLLTLKPSKVHIAHLGASKTSPSSVPKYPEFHFFFFQIYLFLRDRERQSMSRGGAEEEGGTESEAGSSLQAVSTEPYAGLEPTHCEIMT